MSKRNLYMGRQKIITAIDIGTEKICTLIAAIGSAEKDLQVIGVSSVQSRGLRKSQIVDLEEAMSSITESVDSAERMAGMGIKSAFVTISGAHIESQNSKGVVAVANPETEITPEDVTRVIEAARAISLPSTREVIHVIPRDYKVDSQEGIKDPVGMSGVRLEAEAHIITGFTTSLKNTAKCLNDVGLQVDGFVFSGLASSYSSLTETERELGVVLLDIGAGSSSLCAFVEGSLMYSAVLPIGARHITSDIALGARISLQSAERIKIMLSSLPPSLPVLSGETREQSKERKRKEDAIDPKKIGITEPLGILSRKTIADGIIVPRLQEMFKLIGGELEKNSLFSQIPAGIVLTGGGAETVGIVEVCKRVLALPTRIGRPQGLHGLVEEIGSSQFSAAAGLLQYAAQSHVSSTVKQKGFDIKELFKGASIKDLPKKIISFLRSLLP